ncbi:UDP-N-acetylglucosamine 1-carboxyvinyltransferase [bacterium]|jgi:UDP-N-acetylglucosamine 1-carboxyvinyltransferase|nr:UDP-N-acetylglucosamine 1-carboxyvinyltransferase [bacterium]
MDKIRIKGGKAIRGRIDVAGSKNAALPILLSSLLTDQPSQLARVPQLQDINTTLLLLEQMGVKVENSPEQHKVKLNAAGVKTFEAPYDLVRKMRASVLVLGPLVARFGQARVSLPGGCAIGARPIGFHLSALEKLGAKIELEEGYVLAKAKKLKGARVAFEFPSVGATENTLMAAALAEGESVLENCAREPEIVDLAQSLKSMGAIIEGEGTETIYVQGKKTLGGINYSIMGDRIEAGTYLAAALATRGEVTVNGISPLFLESVLAKFEETGARIERGDESVTLKSHGRPISKDVITMPFPGFPTDMQAQFMAVMAVADGASLITENIFENRFMHVPELSRLGADISIRGKAALVKGKSQLKAAPIMATDLRASASLIIGGLCAEGETVISRIYHLDRGYERMEEKLRKLGADIERLK